MRMTNKEKINLAMKLIHEVIDDTQTEGFSDKSERNKKIQGVLRTFGEDFKLKLRPLVSWIQESD
jgi:hypothetical protein